MSKSVKAIAVGDVVHLKSGSPRMTIIEIDKNHARVLWSDYETKTFCRDEFPLVALAHA